MCKLPRSLLLILTLALLNPCAWPQASNGRVSGTVRDQSGAAIPNLHAALTNTATNMTSATQTNEVGFYFYPAAIPGPYRLVIEAPGMEKYEVVFTVQVAQSVVIDPVLKPGALTAVVEVKDVTPMVTTDNATLRSGMERERIEQLPINGRNLTTLLRLQPGSEDGSYSPRTFGGLEGTLDWIVDGATRVDPQWGHEPHAGPGLDSIQEFTVESNAVSTKYSRPVNVVVSTKSGTNQFHGSAFETHRNNAIGLARSRTDFYTKPPQLIRNEFGASSGGPVIIPKLYNGKDRTFWFFNYEGYRLASATTWGFRVPTMAMRKGDFSNLKDSQGRLQKLYDPWTTAADGARQPFNYGGTLNVIDPNRISPVAKYLFDITPAPTNEVNPLVDNNWWGPKQTKENRWVTTTRLDHRFSDRDTFYAVLNIGTHFIAKPVHNDGATGMQYGNGVAGWQLYRRPQKSLALTWVHSLSPTFFNELIVSGTRGIYLGREGDGSGVGTDTNWSDKFNLPNPFNSKLWPYFQNTGLTGYAMQTNDTKSYWNNWQIVDNNVTKIHGKHEFLFGTHLRFYQLNIQAKQRYAQAWVNWATMATALYDSKSSLDNPQAMPYTGHNLGNMFLGVSTYANSLSKGMYYLREKEYALYFQDNFKATPRLTLNYGLRWEYWPALHDKYNVMIGFDRTNRAIVTGASLDTMYALGATTPELVAKYQALGAKFETPEQAGLPKNLLNSWKRNFGPRVGFAYQARAGNFPFVVRGGYSVSYFNIPIWKWNDNNMNNTPLRAQYEYNPMAAGQSPDGYSNWLLRNTPVYVDGVNSGNAVDIKDPQGITRGSTFTNYFDQNMPAPTMQSWNLTFEKELMASTVARARYIGTHQSGLSQNYNTNTATPTYIWYMTTGLPLPTGEYANVARRPYDQQVYGEIQQYRQTGWANYNGIELELARRYKKGYAFELSYLMSNALNSTGDAYGGFMTETNQYLPGLVPTDYDERNRLLNYKRDTIFPKHRVRWNWLIDLPIGRGKWLGRNSSNLLDKVIGGWQLAGIGTLRSTYFSLPTGNWNFTGEPIQLYGYQYPIENCTGGSCVPGYLWWNGYIPSNKINSHDASGKPNGYMGIPANYKPAVTPLIPWGSTDMPANAPAGTNISSFWDTNNVWVPLKNGKVERVGYDTGLNPWRNQFLPSVRQWGLDASLFKSAQLTERVALRFNMDFFNVLNHPGNPNSVGGNGMLTTQSSGQNPRVLQLTLRLIY
ncbi:MAG TPA: TonB-dependent receptor [Clostridia bacterium]|nr:TonB-dependent receptor [Clostridia bacterium]